MVSRLIEQDDVGVLHGKDSKHYSVPQTIRQLVDGAGLVSTSDTESTNLLPPELNVLVGELFAVERSNVLDGRLVVRELIGRVLRVLGELELSVLVDGTLDRLEGAGDKIKKGGFTGTIVTDNGDSRVHVDTERQILIQVVLLLTRVRESNV